MVIDLGGGQRKGADETCGAAGEERDGEAGGWPDVWGKTKKSSKREVKKRRAEAERVTLSGDGNGDERETYAMKAKEWAHEATRNPEAAEVLGNGDAVWAVRFEQRTPVMKGGAELMTAIRDSVNGHGAFVERKLGDGLVQFDYKEPWPRHFVWAGRGDTVEGKKQWRLAWLRRELRGVVMHESGEVMVRGLPKFFNLGQLMETKMKVLMNRQVLEVTEKLDGQMVTGVLVGGTVQYWSRKGLTVVGVTAGRIAAEHAGYDRLVQEAVSAGSCGISILLLAPRAHTVQRQTPKAAVKTLTAQDVRPKSRHQRQR